MRELLAKVIKPREKGELKRFFMLECVCENHLGKTDP
jgi:hypothetical protein